MKKILGLDLGTNSIGWALVEQNFEEKQGKILGMGSRIIPSEPEMLGRFSIGQALSKANAGQAYTPAGKRTDFRGIRRLRERHLLRRERLLRVLNILDLLPAHFANQIDFNKHLGQFLEDKEPKIAYHEKQFIFKKSFNEMLEDFRKNQPELLNRKNKKGNNAKIPYDWTIYYLRKKALSHKLEKEELAWLILSFNQKRGYYQLRGEDDQDATRTAQTRIYFDNQTISEIVDTGDTYKGLKVILIKLVNGDTGKYFSKEIPNWVGMEKNIIATIDLDKDGNDKYEDDGSLKRRFSIPTEEDWDKKWKLVKIKTEEEIKKSAKTVGTYIYDTLLQKPNQKIRGKLVRTIERRFYKEELKAILNKQVELQPELFSDDLYNDCVRELYRHNEAHQLQLSKRNFIHLFVEDIIFYQRPLKSKKSTIGNCSLESRPLKEKNGQPKLDKDGKQLWKLYSTIPKSNPYYQEFRVWQWLHNLKIFKKDDDTDVTQEFIKSIKDLENLYQFLMSNKKVDHKDILKYFFKDLKGKILNAEIAKYRWNYVYDPVKDESKVYPCNKTGIEIRDQLDKVENLPATFFTPEIEQHLWHIIYSVTDKNEFEKALKTFARKYSLDESSFVESFKKFKPFENDYGSYSEKAIKKLLPLMRLGKYWNWDAIDCKTQGRIEKILTGEYDEKIKDRVREKAIQLTESHHFQGLQLWLAQYIVYDRHSEAALTGKWKSVADLEEYQKEFRQHSLRNPIVEQVVTETLRVVRDIWAKYGKGTENYFDEIHIELGREMKNTADDRKKITNQISDNENTNLRIKALIAELKNDPAMENVRPYSPMQQEALKIYEDGVINSNIEIPEDIIKISKTAQPTKSELTRYKLWLEQKYRSPYTGQVIPLGRLFTEDYQIEHIIPQSRYFDDSLSNKVICEAAVNQLKDNQLGAEFIKNHHGEMVETGNGNKVKIFTEDDYTEYVKQHYDKNRGKRTKLLLEDIPEKMIERQLNDTRYISKFISNLLSNIVRSEKDDDGVNSKNIIPGNGKITSTLKQDWGLNDVWNNLILPRFVRMNELTNSKVFTLKNKEGHTIPAIPFELSKGFQKKRIDHRHHAMDALVIACATRDHVNLLNNQSAKSDSKRYDLQHKLRNTEKWIDNEGKERDKFTEFKKPWENFTPDARNELERIVVSFKQNLRVINKTTNKYESYKDENGKLRIGKDGKPKKDFIPQTKGDSWAIRKPLHKDTVSGEVKLACIKVPKGKILTATRKALNTSFNLKTIESITDTGIQKILKNYLASKDNIPELAFSPEGLEGMNQNIARYNEGKSHQPIYKVRVFELGSKFALGYAGNKKAKYVEAAKGTNLFFTIFQDENGKCSYETIPLNIVIERQKQGLTSVPETNENGDKLLFHLSPNDLVYVPTEDEKENLNTIDFGNLNKGNVERVYKMVSSTSTECHFIHANIASLIKSYDAKSKIGELGSLNKLEVTLDYSARIKESFIKLKVDRLGNISRIVS